MIIKSGDIEVVVNEPLFAVGSVWYPGYSEIKSFQVKNRGDKTRQVQIEALSENETKNLSQGLNLKVRNDAGCVYGCNEIKTLKNFFDVGTLNVGEVSVNDDGKVFDMEAMMPIMVGNEYQGGKVSFDLKIGLEGDAESTVTVAGGGGAPTSISTPTPIMARTKAVSLDEPLILGEILGEEVTPAVTSGTVMGETAPLRQGFEGQAGNIGGILDWWWNWWWLVLLLILTAAAWWWNRRRKKTSLE